MSCHIFMNLASLLMKGGKKIRNLSIMGTIALVVYGVLELTDLVLQNIIFEKIAGYCETLALVTVIMIMAHTTGLIYKMQRRKSNVKITKLPKVVQMIIAGIIAFAGAAIIKLLLVNVFGL